jgi:RNA polymerase sigma-B factor
MVEPRRRSSVSAANSEKLEEQVERYARSRDARLRESLIHHQRGLVEALASRFTRRGAPIEDLIQVGTVGLIMALDRFDPTLGVKFSTYAVSTIVGEIKHFFRDCTWAIKVPRQLQDIAANLPRAEEKLCAKLGRTPSIRELAAYFHVTEEELLEAMDLDQAYSPYSLDAELGSEPGDSHERLQDVVGFSDQDLESIVEYAPLRAAMQRLDARKQWILQRRYFDEWSQNEVSRELGISQMHVSRLEREALMDLRRALDVRAA